MNRRLLAFFFILFAALAVLAAPVNVTTDVRITSIYASYTFATHS
jgi:hypothetical protein